MNATKMTIPIAVALVLPALAVAAYQPASAQQENPRFLLRLIDQTAQAGLVNVDATIGNVVVNDVADVVVDRNNIAVPVTITAAVPVNVAAEICATIIATDEVVCEQVQNVEQNARNVVTLDLSQAQ